MKIGMKKWVSVWPEWDQMKGQIVQGKSICSLWLVKLHETAEKQACSIIYSHKDELGGKLS